MHIHGRQQPLKKQESSTSAISDAQRSTTLLQLSVSVGAKCIVWRQAAIPSLSPDSDLTEATRRFIRLCSADHLCQKVWLWQCREQKQWAHAEDVAPHTCCGQNQTAHMVKAFAYLEASEGSWCPTSLLYSQRRNTATPAKSM